MEEAQTGGPQRIGPDLAPAVSDYIASLPGDRFPNLVALADEFATARAIVKHAGLAPREKLSGAFTGRTRLTGQGRPGLRLAAWRAVWGAQRAYPVYRARYQHLTSREQNKLTPTQAQTIIAAAILRQLHAVITTGQAWDPATATHGTRRESTPLAA
jgi:transposase